MLKRWLCGCFAAGLLLGGCGSRPQAGSGMSGSATPATPDEAMWRTQYVNTCMQQIKGEDLKDVKKTPDEVCNCVADKMISYKHAAQSAGGQQDVAQAQQASQEMMACMGIQMPAGMPTANETSSTSDDTPTSNPNDIPPSIPDNGNGGQGNSGQSDDN